MFLCSKHMFICLWNKALCALNGFVMKVVRVDKGESGICSIYECSFGQNGYFWIWFWFFMVGWLGFVLFEINYPDSLLNFTFYQYYVSERFIPVECFTVGVR